MNTELKTTEEITAAMNRQFDEVKKLELISGQSNLMVLAKKLHRWQLQKVCAIDRQVFQEKDTRQIVFTQGTTHNLKEIQTYFKTADNDEPLMKYWKTQI